MKYITWVCKRFGVICETKEGILPSSYKGYKINDKIDKSLQECYPIYEYYNWVPVGVKEIDC